MTVVAPMVLEATQPVAPMMAKAPQNGYPPLSIIIAALWQESRSRTSSRLSLKSQHRLNRLVHTLSQAVCETKIVSK